MLVLSFLASELASDLVSISFCMGKRNSYRITNETCWAIHEILSERYFNILIKGDQLKNISSEFEDAFSSFPILQEH